MRKFRSSFFIIFSLLVIVGIFVANDQIISDSSQDGIEKEVTDAPKLKSNQSTKEVKELIEGDLFQLIEKTSTEVREALGDPVRKDLTPYGYTWWVYTDEIAQYILIGLEGDSVQTIYATGSDISSQPFKIGTAYEEIAEQFPITEKVTYQTGLAFYSFLLNETDRQLNPLIELGENLYVQAYFDTFTNELSSVRIITGDMLLKQRFYEMEYRGTLPAEEALSHDDWEKIESGMKQQVFDLTNIYRARFDLRPLVLDEQVSEVAFLHSKDMYDHNYFSHYGLDGTGLKERLADKEVYYLSAGENIAAQHTDAPAAVEGWLNSKGHREALLNDNYTHLGVGVHRLYYTQNFLLKH